MTHLDIGPEEPRKPLPGKVSKHVLDLKTLDGAKKASAHQNVSVNLKEEIKIRTVSLEKMQIVGRNYARRRGLGRLPMIAAALVIILLLNVLQLAFVGQQRGEAAIALASEGFMTLQGAGQSFVSGETETDPLIFDHAQELFEEAKEKGGFLLKTETPWLSEPTPVKSLKNLLDAGSLMAQVGAHLSSAKTALDQWPTEGSLTEYLRSISEKDLEPAAVALNTIQTQLADVDLTGTEYAERFVDYREKLGALAELLNLWVEMKEPLLAALGDRYPQTYMVLLENNDEMRPGGGFNGSFALVTLNDGRLTQMDFHDVYDYDGLYFEHQEVPIHELTGLTSEWRLRDSNTSPDFAISAQQALWFLEKEGGPGVDGVIGLNASAMQGFMEAVGPVTVPSLPKALTAETFPAVISTLVEAKAYGQDNPKAVLGEFLTAFMTQCKDPAIASKVLLKGWEESQKKQILFYQKDPSVQAMFTTLQMSGTLPQFGTLQDDFFMPVFTNIGGNKTDRYVSNAITHDTQILEDGSMVATVTFTRSHSFNDGTLAWLKSTLRDYGFTAWNGTLESILGNAPNKTGIRVYVPEGSRLLDTQGLYRDEVQYFYDPLEDVSYFYFDQTLAPGETQTVALQFALPMNLKGKFQEYHFQVFKQPGLKNTTFTKTITAPSDVLLSAEPSATDTQVGKNYVFTGSLERDWSLTGLFE